ncbi:MAG: LacI family DNA-binding transcriptional regulator [Ilumatobacteraceae bacterium]
MTLEDVATEAGVSRALVSLVMRDSPRVSRASRELVLDASVRMGYRPNLIARNLASRRTMTIGLLLNDLHNPWFAEIADGMFAEADANGYRIILGSGRRSTSREDSVLESFLSFRVDGIVVAGCRLAPKRIEHVGAEVPVVSVGRAIRSEIVATVNSDDRMGAHLAVEHLVGLGHREIVHIDGGRGAGSSPRRAGYLAAMKEFGLRDQSRVVPADFTEAAGAAAVERLLADAAMPTALFTSNDLLAIGALDRLEQAGLAVPDDVSIVGYDNTSLAGLHHFALTTVDQPREQMGRVAFTTLLERLDGVDGLGASGRAVHHVMSPQLIERRSTRRIKLT